MNLRRKQAIISILVVTFVYLIVFYQNSDSIINSTFWMAFFFCSYILFLLVFYFLLGLEKSEKFLHNNEKWDSPKGLLLIEIVVWVFFFILFYLYQDISILLNGIALSIVYLSGSYMRKLYREDLKK